MRATKLMKNSRGLNIYFKIFKRAAGIPGNWVFLAPIFNTMFENSSFLVFITILVADVVKCAALGNERELPIHQTSPIPKE